MPDPHAPLKDDIHLLGNLLGERLKASEGQALFETVERVRALSKAAHAPDGAPAFAALADLLSAIPMARAFPVARAFSQFLTLANVAEQHHRLRRRRDYQRNPDAGAQRGSFNEALGRLIREGISPDRLHDAVSNLRVELVFTAHPTEIVRRTLVQAYARIADLLAEHDRPDLTPQEQTNIVDALRREVAILWGTDEVRDTRPTPLDEVRWGLAVFEQTLWDAVPATYRALEAALRAHTGQPLPDSARPIRFGSWIGGDRDGNPNVTPDVTRRATLMARWVAANLFAEDVTRLEARLSFERGSERLEACARTQREPYRALLRDLRSRLRLTRTQLEAALTSGAHRIDEPITSAELQETLKLCHASLVETGNEVVANGMLLDVRRRASIFGLALVPLDLRQESEQHEEAVNALSAGAYASLDERARQKWLIERLEEPDRDAARNPHAAAATHPVLDVFQMAAGLHRDSLGAYVITMAGAPSDVLEVAYLQKLAGISPPLRIVPLFETARDLQNARATLRDLLAMPSYRARLVTEGDRQEVMVGYSDSAKDAGRFAAAWDLYRAQEEIVAACREAGVQLTLFHGRGGSVGRGGGPTYLAIQSQPPGSIDGSLRVTEQGEMLQAKFGLRGIAERTLEVYVSATLEARLSPRPEPPREFHEEMDHLANEAREAFRRTISTEDFRTYFRQATPEQELEFTNIGSRPARRQGGALRAIPWQFAWTQSRLLLASWLGAEVIADRGERVRRMYREWPFFQSTVDLIEMVLAKADPRIAAEYDRRLVDPALLGVGEDLRRRLERAAQGVLEVTGHQRLLDDNQVLRRSIDVRNPYVDPINIVQIELLRRLRSDAGANDGTAGQAFVVTVNGIAAGMRNTG